MSLFKKRNSELGKMKDKINKQDVFEYFESRTEEIVNEYIRINAELETFPTSEVEKKIARQDILNSKLEELNLFGERFLT